MQKLRAMERRRGSVLMVSLIMVFLVAGMGLCMVQLHISETRRQVQATDNKRALYIAEAGLAEAFVAVAEGRSGAVGSAELPALFGNGVYWVEATDTGDGQVALVSTGLCGTGRFSVSITLQRENDSIASLGFFSGDELTVETAALIDGYNSEEGDYASQVDPTLEVESTGRGARLASNAGVTLEGPRKLLVVDLGGSTTVYGDVVPGPLDAVSQGSGVVVTGSTAPAESTSPLPPVEIPAMPVVKVDGVPAGDRTLPAGEYHFSSVHIPSRTTIEVTGPSVVVFDELILDGGATLKLNTETGRIVLYVVEHLACSKGAQFVNTTENPSSFILQVAAEDWSDFDRDGVVDPPVDFAPSGTFHGFIYSPDTEIKLPASLRFFGGAAAQGLTLEAGARVTFDTALKSTGMVAAGLPRLVAWRVVELPEEELVDLRRDPLATLANAGKTPTRTADAYDDRYVRMKYYDTSGVGRSFSGLASNLDWLSVGKVVAVQWDNDAVIGDEGQKLRSGTTVK